MAVMSAFRLLADGEPARYCEVPTPVAGPGEVVVAVRAAGLCRTDLALQAGRHDGSGLAPFTLGHEVAGQVVEVGAGVDQSLAGERVLVSAMYYCGDCEMCVRGAHSVCRAIGVPGYGVGIDGGVADFMLVQARHIVPIGTLDYACAAPLADAAATTYHAVRSMHQVLVPGSTAVVIGVGGLGAFAVQWLVRLPGVHVLAIDRDQTKLSLAAALGAHEAVLTDNERVAEFGRGVDVVLDLVGTDGTLATGLGLIRGGGRLMVAGIAGGRIQLGWDLLPRNGQFINTRGYDRPDLVDVVRIAEGGGLQVPHQRYSFDDVGAALDDLAGGRVAGRAVLVRPSADPQPRAEQVG